MIRYIFILMALVPHFLRAADDADATKHFQEYLAQCGTNEIRCVWFLQDKPNVGMVMTLNLQDESVYTVREVYNWALQCSETRKLTHLQVLSLQKISGELPPSDPNAEFGRAVSVSIRRGSKVDVFHYNRQRAPAVIQRIYDIGGGYFSDRKGANKTPDPMSRSAIRRIFQLARHLCAPLHRSAWRSALQSARYHF